MNVDNLMAKMDNWFVLYKLTETYITEGYSYNSMVVIWLIWRQAWAVLIVNKCVIW